MTDDLPPTDHPSPSGDAADTHTTTVAEHPEHAAGHAPAAEPAAEAHAPERAEAAAEEAPPAETPPEEPPPVPPVATEATEPPPPSNKRWYVVKVQSGREESIKSAIEKRIKIEGLDEFFGQIVIPTEKVTELSKGKRVVKKHKKFPGYLMVEVEYNDRILYLFRETSGVGDFVGGSLHRAPPPMSDREVQSMLAGMQEGGQEAEPKRIKIDYEAGDKVRVRDGTFAGMEGEVKEIIEPREAKDTMRVRVVLTIFGRPVDVELEYWQVDKT
jgi:transcriptional antiterminator NusG